MERADEPSAVSNVVDGGVGNNVVQAGAIHGDVHLHNGPRLIPTTTPPARPFGPGAELGVDGVTCLIHDFPTHEGPSADGGAVLRAGRCSLITPDGRRTGYGWLRQVQIHHDTQQARAEVAALADEHQLNPGRFVRTARSATLVTEWPESRAGKPCDSLESLLGPTPMTDSGRLYHLSAGLVGLCKTLATLHNRGRTHRALTPAGLVVRDDGRLVLRDLGLAVRPFRPGEHACDYQAPEQRPRTAGTPGPHTDVYQLGAVAYHLVTGRVPHRATLPVHTWARTAPVGLAAAIDAALAPDCGRRPDPGAFARMVLG
ncbi:hypothetical protein [Actinokineospora sp. NBRC 105648]|uniref:hypothetical protein n=1 Tax=Actinokineospora sp. NBRC 105648 TaxID=3032206 RepID=UPI0024A37D21|nr:hypothetical protein [Actinokineospora sp. NBRC 105648]GLZ43298.1 hypothetical protein Acsp05_69220 [Actinokineospora sp. NBRC 105648]